MSKLEDQLRESRRKERPELQPPAGGWEAIQASLAATAAGAAAAGAAGKAAAGKGGVMGVAGKAAVSSAAATTAKASLMATIIKSLIGVVVVGGMATGGYLMTPQDGNTAEEQLVATGNGTKQPVGQSDNASTVGQDAATLNSVSETAADRVDEPSVASGNTTDVITASVGAPVPRNVSDDAVLTPENNQLPGPSQHELPSPSPGGDASGNSGSTPDLPGGAVPASPAINTQPETKQLPLVPQPDTAKTAAFASEDEHRENVSAGDAVETNPSVILTDFPVEEERPRNMVVAALERSKLNRVSFQWSTTPLALETEILPADNTFGKYRRAEWSAWQVHGGVNFLVGNRAFGRGDVQVFERTDPAFATETLVLPNGEVIGVLPNRFVDSESLRSDNFHYRLGVTRQFRWGGAVRGGLNHYRYNLTTVFDRTTLTDNELISEVNDRERATFLDIEFQYTLLRRHRFRPFVGIGTILLSNYNVTEESTFFDAQSGAVADRGLSTNNSTLSTGFDISLSTGFQYQLSNRLSLGAQLWGNWGVNFYVEAPVGFEIRYTLE